MSTTHKNNSRNQLVSTPPPSQFKKTHRDFGYYQIRSEKSELVSLKKINDNENIVVEGHEYQTANSSLGKPSISLAQKQESTMAAEEKISGRDRKKPDDESTVAPAEESGRERLKRHRVEMAGRVWIPDIWGQEDLLKDWIDCTAFDASSLVNGTIMSARAALMQQPANSTTPRVPRRRIENKIRC